MSWLEQGVEAHEAADEALRSQDWDSAVEALRPIAEPPGSTGLAPDDERAIRQDAYFRLARIEVERLSFAAALTWADAGLELGSGDDLFTANLLTVRGQANRGLGQDRDAARDYFEAQRISTLLLERSLQDGSESDEGEQ